MVSKFLRLPLRRKLLLALAVLFSFVSYLLYRFFPRNAKVESKRSFRKMRPRLLRDIAWAVRQTKDRMPWENVCRHQAYQVKLFCAVFGQPFEVYVGFKKSPETGKVEGHTWTKANGHFLSGWCQEEEYTLQAGRY
jgi:hypothetical protein